MFGEKGRKQSEDRGQQRPAKDREVRQTRGRDKKKRNPEKNKCFKGSDCGMYVFSANL